MDGVIQANTSKDLFDSGYAIPLWYEPGREKPYFYRYRGEDIWSSVPFLYETSFGFRVTPIMDVRRG